MSTSLTDQQLKLRGYYMDALLGVNPHRDPVIQAALDNAERRERDRVYDMFEQADYPHRLERAIHEFGMTFGFAKSKKEGD